jgi:heat-inducible transcriptional repressor
MELEARARSVLQVVVEAYIDDAQAVSSSSVARRAKGLGLSPASIRNVMAELESLGLLHQPHTSAGRVPTEAGLRVYLDGLMSPKLHPWDRTRLDAAASQLDELGEFPALLGQSLAGLSGQMAIIAVPRFLGTRFHEVGLVRVNDRRLLAYFVSPAGLVQQKLVEVDFDVAPESITWIQNYLSACIQDRSLEDVRALVQRELQEAEALSDSLRRQALEICQRALPAPEVRILVEGASRLASQPEFADVEKLRSVMRAIDDKATLLKLLNRILEHNGVRVVLSSEHHLPEVSDLACVGGGLIGNASAAIGLVGPARMDYGRLVPMVRYATELFERYWRGI